MASRFGGGWIGELTAIEVYWFVYHALKAEANDRGWQVRSASFPNASKRGQTAIINDLHRLDSVGKVRKHPWEVVDVDSGVDMIGLECKIHGVSWLDKHPNARELLAARGVSPGQAIELHEKWQRGLFESLGRDEHGQLIKDGSVRTQSIVEHFRR